MKKLFMLSLVCSVAGCEAPGENTSGRLSGYQYTPVQDMGNNTFWIQGYDTEDAITGANAHCAKLRGRFRLVEMIPHTQRERATLTFSC